MNSTPAATTVTPVSTPALPATPPNPQTPTAPGFSTPYPPPFAYPHPYPYPSPVAPFHGYPAPGFFNPSAYPAPWGGGLASGDHSAQDPRSSPPPSGGSLEDFCSQYNLGEETRTRLEELGFEVGDDLTSVKEAHWERVGFAPLAWGRVLKAYNKYKKSLKHM